MKYKDLRKVVDEFDYLGGAVNSSDNKKQATARAFYHSGLALIDLLATAKKDNEEFAKLVDEAQTLITDIKDLFYDLQGKVKELNEYTNDDLDTSSFERELDDLSDGIDNCELAEIDEDEMDEMELSDLYDMVSDNE